MGNYLGQAVYGYYRVNKVKVRVNVVPDMRDDDYFWARDIIQ